MPSLSAPTGAEAETPTIASASDLRELASGSLRTPDTRFGSASAPPAISAVRSPRVPRSPCFLSADEEYMLALARERYALDEGVRYAERRLALMVPKGSPLRSDDTLKH